MKSKEIVIGGVSSKELLILVRQLYAAMKAGYNTAQALDIAVTESKGRLRQILEQVIKDVDSGAYLFEAFSKHQKYFSPLFLNLIKTGEMSASLQENLLQLVTIIQKDQDFKHKIRSAMAYPIFVFIAVIGLGLAMAFFVLPNLLPLFGSLNVELPLSTRVLMWFAKVFDQYGMQIFLAIIFIIISIIILIRQEFSKPFTHWLILKTPLLGRLSRQLNMSRLGRSLASLTRSGMPIDESVKVTATILTNYYFVNALKTSLPAIQKGQTLANALKKNMYLFDDIFIKLIALGESTSGLEESCDNVSEYYESEMDESMKNLAISLEPMLIIIVGIIVAFVAFSIIGPIYKITGSLR